MPSQPEGTWYPGVQVCRVLVTVTAGTVQRALHFLKYLRANFESQGALAAIEDRRRRQGCIDFLKPEEGVPRARGRAATREQRATLNWPFFFFLMVLPWYCQARRGKSTGTTPSLRKYMAGPSSRFVASLPGMSGGGRQRRTSLSAMRPVGGIYKTYITSSVPGHLSQRRP